MSIEKKILHKLLVPVECEGTTRTVIEIRRVKAKDLRGLNSEDTSLDEMLDLIKRLSGWPTDAIDELDQADLEVIGDIIAGFSKKRRR